MLLLAIRTGLRVGELRALRWTNVDIERGVIRVREAAKVPTARDVKAPKNNRFRDVPLSDDARAILKSHRHLKSSLVFCDGTGRMFLEHHCKHACKRASAAAKLGRVAYWHVYRHTFASHLVMRGVPIRTVQELLGHSSIQQTMRYAHLAPNIPREAVKLLDQPAPVPAATKDQTA